MTDNLAVPLFPSSDRVPEAHRIGATVEQREYLCNGRIRTWTGAQQDVFSPVCEAVDGAVGPKRIGSYPLLGAEQAMEALEQVFESATHGAAEVDDESIEPLGAQLVPQKKLADPARSVDAQQPVVREFDCHGIPLCQVAATVDIAIGGCPR